MAIENEINRLGGIQPLEAKYYPLSQAEVGDVENEVVGKLPDDYVHLLLTYGEFTFINSIEFILHKQKPEYKHKKSLGIPNGTDFSGSMVALMYGKRKSADSFTLIRKLQVFRSRMPAGFLPFADDGLGNQLCICLQADNYQKIYWWDHELEWDEDDYEEEVGKTMPVTAKYQNVYLVADSMTSFFERLTISARA